MKFSVYVFSNQFTKGQINFDIVSMHKLFAMGDSRCEKLVFFDYDKDQNWKALDSENENTIVFMENKNIDDFVVMGLAKLGTHTKTIDEQALVFEKNGKTIAFLPIDGQWKELIKKIVKLKDGRKVYSFKLFGKSKEELEAELKDIKNTYSGLEYQYFCNNLLYEVFLTYEGENGKIDEVQMHVASKFKDSIYSENELGLEEVILGLLKLKKYKISIYDDASCGYLENRLLGNADYHDVTNEIRWDENFCPKTSEGIYNFSLARLNEGSDIVLAFTKKNAGDGEEFLFAVADKKAVHVFKNKFAKTCLQNKFVSTNSALFQIFKKLKQNDFAF